jgi:hypothetical protein
MVKTMKPGRTYHAITTFIYPTEKKALEWARFLHGEAGEAARHVVPVQRPEDRPEMSQLQLENETLRRTVAGLELVVRDLQDAMRNRPC